MTFKKSVFIFSIALSLFLPACSNEQHEILRVGTNIWSGYEPLYMARDTKILDQNKVRLVEYSSASQVLQAFRNGLIDGAALTLDEAMLLLQTNDNPKVVLVLDISMGGDVIIGQPGMKSLSDIKGKKIGVEGTALGAYMITRALEVANIDKSSVQLKSINIDQHEKRFRNGEVDAVVTFEPIRSKLLHAGGVQLFDSSKIPNEIFDVLVIRDDYLKNNKSVLEHLKTAWYKSLDMFAAEPEKSAVHLGKRMKLNVKDTLASYEGLVLPGKKENEALLKNGKNSKLSQVAVKLSELMKQNTLLQQDVDVTELFKE